MDNGPNYEPTGTNLPEGVVYCVLCGTTYMWTQRRACPTCTAYETIEVLKERVEELEQEMASD